MRIPIRYSPVWSWLLTILGLPQRVRRTSRSTATSSGSAWRGRSGPSSGAATCSDVSDAPARREHRRARVARPLARERRAPPDRPDHAWRYPSARGSCGFPVQVRELLVSVDDVAELRRRSCAV